MLPGLCGGRGVFCRTVGVVGAFHVETHFMVVPDRCQRYQ
jgi:hypothetical protein